MDKRRGSDDNVMRILRDSDKNQIQEIAISNLKWMWDLVEVYVVWNLRFVCLRHGVMGVWYDCDKILKDLKPGYSFSQLEVHVSPCWSVCYGVFWYFGVLARSDRSVAWEWWRTQRLRVGRLTLTTWSQIMSYRAGCKLNVNKTWAGCDFSHTNYYKEYSAFGDDIMR